MSDILEEWIYSTLNNDAKLQTLLGGQKVYYNFPPLTVALPAISYTIGSVSNVAGNLLGVHDVRVDITIYGGDVEAIGKRIYDILDHKSALLVKEEVYILKFDSSGPMMWDEKEEAYFRTDSYYAVKRVVKYA